MICIHEPVLPIYTDVNIFMKTCKISNAYFTKSMDCLDLHLKYFLACRLVKVFSEWTTSVEPYFDSLNYENPEIGLKSCRCILLKKMSAASKKILFLWYYYKYVTMNHVTFVLV